MANPLKEYAVPYQKGDVIFKEGENGSEMFVIQSGKVEIYKEINGEKVFSLIMEKGDFFGEMSLLESLPRTANAVMLEDGELIVINATIFDQMIRQNIEIAVRMLRKFSTRLRETMAKLEAVTAGSERQKTVPLEIGKEEPKEEKKAEDDKPPVLAQFMDEETLKVYPICKEITLIGRNDPVTGHTPDVDLTDLDTVRSVSRRHAKLIYNNGIFYLSEEPGTLNGTFVNNKKIQSGIQVPVKSGMIVGFGMIRLKFVEAAAFTGAKKEKK
ncbi:MAG: cyclic nucleotide-binding domain-containing protein [Acidobacteria bacterium]|nr:cyclic nucleotide-binding domain-containing protein [Acidobacteriota bacterium]